MRCSPAQRDQLRAAFRLMICQKLGVAPFRHQAEWWLASDGLMLTEAPDPNGFEIQLPDKTRARYATIPRPGGIAHVIADLGAFKIGKSFSSGIWAASFAVVPDSKVSLVGYEYDMCTPEFDYICEALLSSRGLGLKAKHLSNSPRTGNMFLELENGAKFDCKSWERKDSLKGKEVDAYVYCEAYQLPDLSCYTSVKQNLDARRGYAVFATTPDHPWVQIFHDKAHGQDRDFLDWECTCGTPRSVNPFTFDSRSQDLDDPTKGGLMTREKFAIAYLGRMGDYVGRVYNYQRGQRLFTPESHPFLYRAYQSKQLAHAHDRFSGIESTLDPPTVMDLSFPEGWKIEGALDTGTYMASLLVALSPEGEAFVFWEEPNYGYVASELELHKDSSIADWGRAVRAMMIRFDVRHMWRDPNSQFTHELSNHYDIQSIGQSVKLEARTEIARTYFQLNRIWLAPWLKILPYEIEQAQWPEEHTAAGRFERIKRNDHTLDCLEHVLAKHPHGRQLVYPQPQTWAESQGYQHTSRSGNSHLGTS